MEDQPGCSKWFKKDEPTTSSSVNLEEYCDDSIIALLDEPFDPVGAGLNSSRLRTDDAYRGFDNNVGDTWIYPTNFPVRCYQFNITKTALFANTLVVLPTGLGKTFIAAVVMYNIYRWYPTGKVIFMAPTRPLVAQQIEACRQIVGIPAEDLMEITGKNIKKSRKELWRTKRVFFVTPQVVQSDINDPEQEFPFKDVKLVVVDEAHRAKGRYAYTEVIQTLHNRNPYFRVLALSATPGRHPLDVREVVRNLFISRIEVRCENSIDVANYTHKKILKTITVRLDRKLSRIRQLLLDIIEPHATNLIENRLLSGSLDNFSSGRLIMEQKRFRENSMQKTVANYSSINTDFSICVSLYHALELLERHGIRVFLNYFEDETNSTGEKFVVTLNPKLRKFLDNLKDDIGPNPLDQNNQSMSNGKPLELPDDFDFGHPKFKILKDIVLEHYQKNPESKAIVFTEFRETVLLIHRLLIRFQPEIRPRIFVGQGGTGKIRGVTQKRQAEVMQDFREGISNLLIATSIAEEGLDIGEVDLAICFDIRTKNTTRFVQRIGRTGRRRQGKVIILATEGKENSLIKEIVDTKDKINQKITNDKEVTRMLYNRSPRLVPPEFAPQCLETYIRIEDKVVENPKKSPKKGKKVKKLAEPTEIGTQRDVRTYFKKVELDKDELEVFATPKPGTSKTRKIPKNHKAVADEDSYEVDLGPLPTQLGLNPAASSSKSRGFGRDFEDELKKVQSFIKSDSDVKINEFIQLKDQPNLFKRKFLEANYDQMKEKYEALQAVEGLDDVEITDDGISVLKEEIRLIDEIFEGRNNVKKFLDGNSEDDYFVRKRRQFDKKIAGIFEGLVKRDFLDDFSDLQDESRSELSESLKQANDKENEKNSHVDELPTSDFDDSNTFLLENEGSRYMSQWTQVDSSKKPHESVTLSPVTCSTPVRNRNSQKLAKESPLAKAFLELAESFHLPSLDVKPKDSPSRASTPQKNQFNSIKDDFFNDDFDECLVNTTELMTQAEQRENMAQISKNDTEKSISRVESSLVEIKETEVCQKAQETEVSKDIQSLPVSRIENLNSQLDNFDINELLKPFNSDEFIPSSQNFEPKRITQQNRHKLVDANIIVQKPVDNVLQLQERNVNLNRKSFDDLFDYSRLSEKSLTPVQHETEKSSSPTKNPHVLSTETSPSIFAKLSGVKRSSQLSIFSAKSSSSTNGSSFKTCNSISSGPEVKINGVQNHPGDVANSVLVDESIIVGRKRNKLVINSSSSDSEPEVFATCQTSIALPNLTKKGRKHRKSARRKCEFIQTQAAASDDSDDDEGQVDSNFVVDSLIVSDDEEENDASVVNMRAKYLQSIRSPVRGIFKIPEPKVYNDASKIFSQQVPFEDDSVYKEDSFVLLSDEEVHEVSEICPLEKAEAILEARRKIKRRGDSNKSRIVKRRKILSQPIDSSDEGC